MKLAFEKAIGQIFESALDDLEVVFGSSNAEQIEGNRAHIVAMDISTLDDSEPGDGIFVGTVLLALIDEADLFDSPVGQETLANRIQKTITDKDWPDEDIEKDGLAFYIHAIYIDSNQQENEGRQLIRAISLTVDFESAPIPEPPEEPEEPEV